MTFTCYRNRLRKFPAFVNCTTIDWFSEWPKDALLEVAEKYLEDVNLGESAKVTLSANSAAAADVPDIKTSVASVFVTVHRSVVEMSQRMLFEMKRHNYVTPTNYLELVSGYKT